MDAAPERPSSSELPANIRTVPLLTIDALTFASDPEEIRTVCWLPIGPCTVFVPNSSTGPLPTFANVSVWFATRGGSVIVIDPPVPAQVHTAPPPASNVKEPPPDSNDPEPRVMDV